MEQTALLFAARPQKAALRANKAFPCWATTIVGVLTQTSHIDAENLRTIRDKDKVFLMG